MSRRLILTLVLLALPGRVAAQTCGNVAAEHGIDGTGTEVITLPSPVAAGDTLVVGIRFSVSATVSAISDSLNGAWTLGANSSVGGGGFSVAFLKINSAAGTAVITVSYTASAGGFSVGMSCLKASTNTFEEWAFLDTSSTTTHPAPSTDATCSSGVMVGVLTTNSARTTTFSTATKVNSISGRVHMVFKNFASAGAITDTATSNTTTTSATYHTAVLCAAGGGGGSTVNRRKLLGVGP